MSDVRWTAKLPAIILGVAALLGAAVATSRGRIIAGIALLFLGLAFVTYSFTIKQWCALHQHAWGNAWNELGFHGSLGECIKQKGWFSL